ncbi:MAG: GAF domain-containing protein, partial [Armatimonadota bacterium]
DELARDAASLADRENATLQPGIEVALRRAGRGELPEGREWTWVRRDGRRFPVHLSLSALRDDADTVVGFVGVASDITERREAERRSRFLSDLSEQTRDLRDPIQILAETAEAVGVYFGAARCLFVEVEADPAILTVRCDWSRSGIRSAAGRCPASSFGRAVTGALRAGKRLVVPDVAADTCIPHSRVAVYTALQIGSFLAIPIRRGGLWVGVLSVCDTVRRAWTTDEADLVSLVAERAWVALEKARLLRESEAQARKNERIAETLQRSLLVTPDIGSLPGLEIGAEYQAAWDEALIGGDFYDVFRVDSRRNALVLGDATGKGLAAASHIAEVKYALRAFLREYPGGGPAAALSRLNA